MGKNKQWGKKAWKKNDEEVEAEQDFDAVFSIDRSGKLNAKNKKRLKALKSRKTGDKTKSLESISKRALDRVKKIKTNKKKKDYLKLVDPWATAVSTTKGDTNIGEKKLGARKNRAPKANHIIEGHMIVPEAGTSYNPEKKARRELIEKALEHVYKEKLIQAEREPMHITGNLDSIRNDKSSNLVDKIVQLQEITAKRATKTSWNGQDAQPTLEEFLALSSDEESENEEGEEKTAEEITSVIKNVAPGRLTQRQRNAKRRRKEHQVNVVQKMLKKQKRAELEKLPQLVEEILNTEKPKKEKKIDLHPRLGSLKYKEQFPAVSLEHELKSLKDVTPVGNLTKDLYSNMQRRNKLGVRKKGQRALKHRNPKFKVQTVVGSRKAKVGSVVHSKYEY